MKYFDWNEEKNEILKRTRGISFEEIVNAIGNGNLVDTILHPNQKKISCSKVIFCQYK